MTDDMQIMGELDHQADFAMPEAPTGSKVYSSDRKVYLRFNDAVQRKAQEIGTPEPDQPEMSQEELMERIERFKNPKTTDTLVQMARTTAPEPVENTSPEAMLLNKNNELNNAYKIYEGYENKPFDGLPEDAIDYALDAMGEFAFNFLGPVSFAESGFDAGGTLAQAAHIISSKDPEFAKAFVDFMAEYERLPTWTYEGTGRAFRGIFSDPTTYATAGAGYLFSKVAAKTAQETVKAKLKTLATGALVAEGAVYAGGGEEARMGVEEASGREISGLEKGLRRGISTTIGAAAGPVLARGMQAGGQVIGEIAEAVGKPTMQAIGNVIEEAGEAAKERGGTTLSSGVNPDPLIAAAGDAVAKFRAPTEKKPGIIAFHGSGADFDEFKIEKIGTGEGAQAYGYGLYFAEKEDIARFYKEAMEEPKYLELEGKPLDSVYTADNEEKFADYVNRNFDPEEHDDVYVVLDNLGQGLLSLRDADNMVSGTFRPTEKNLRQIYQKIKPDLVEPEVGEGKMYKVGLEPKPEDMMDYQLPIAEQNPKFLKAFKEIYHDRIKSDPQLSELYPTPDSLTMKDIGLFDKSIVGQAYNTFAKKLFNGDEAALTQALLEKGVSGIKYRDAGSRGGAKSLKDASFNYVIFDDKMIKILEKYGIVGPVAITGIAASQQEGESANVDT